MIELLVILGLVLVNGLLAGAEIAIVSVRRTRLDELVAAGSSAARAVLRLRDNPEVFLATVQVGITVVGATAGAFGGAAFAADLEPLVTAVPLLAPWAREIAFAGVVLVVAYLSVVLGELVPKSLALRYAERYALLVAGPLLGLAHLARPVVWILSASSNAVLRVFGDHTTFVEARLSSEEVRRLIEEATRSGEVDPGLGAIATRALALAPLTAEDVMIHRRFVFSIASDTPLADARRRLREAGHRLAPVVEGAERDLTGYVTWRDLAPSPADAGTAPVRSVARKPWYVPDATPAVDLLREFQRRRVGLAFVVDEYGETAGIVLLQDLLEELVGEMLGEHEAPSASRIRRQPDGSALVDGIVPIPVANRELGLRLPDDGRTSTVGGLCTVLAGGRIPAVGEALRTAGGVLLVPAEVSPRRVRVVSVRPPGSGPPPAEGPAGVRRGGPAV